MTRRRIPALERRPMLLAAARERFGRCGYDGTTLDDVADEAGVAKPVLYRHFASKQELYAQLLLEQVERMQSAVRGALSAAPADADRTRVILDATFAFVEHEPFTWRVMVPDISGDGSSTVTARREAADLAARQAMVLLRTFDVGADVAGDGLEPAHDLDRLWARTSAGVQVQVARWWMEHPHVARSEVVDRAQAMLEALARSLYGDSVTGQ